MKVVQKKKNLFEKRFENVLNGVVMALCGRNRSMANEKKNCVYVCEFIHDNRKVLMATDYISCSIDGTIKGLPDYYGAVGWPNGCFLSCIM